MRKVLWTALVGVLLIGCGSVSDPDSAVNRLSVDGEMTQPEVDSIASVLR
ncbi:MAG: hypothetical protein U5J63_10290 [Fodinibius sp.]|nr:hypothetical protein [Fodinibius sp.]